MSDMVKQDYSVTYKMGIVILRGEYDAIHQQASVILKRFACSACPYQVTRDTQHEIIIAAVH